MGEIDKIKWGNIQDNQEETIWRNWEVINEVKDVLENKKTFSLSEKLNEEIKKSLISPSENQEISSINSGNIFYDSFFEGLTTYELLMMTNWVKEYEIFNSKWGINKYIKYYITKNLKIYEIMQEDLFLNFYNELKNYLYNSNNFNIWENAKLLLNENNEIILTVFKDFSDFVKLPGDSCKIVDLESLEKEETFSFTEDIKDIIFFTDFRHIENMYKNWYIDKDTKNIMHSQSVERWEINLTIWEIHRRFF